MNQKSLVLEKVFYGPLLGLGVFLLFFIPMSALAVNSGSLDGGGGGGGYSESSYYSQGTYYSESTYYTQGAYYSEASYAVTQTAQGVKVYDGGVPYSTIDDDAYANGGILNLDASGIYHGTGSSPSPEGNRACFLVDPTAFPSYWSWGQYHSPGDNTVAKWNGSIWYITGANGNYHFKELDCKTYAVADSALTASAAQIQQGSSVTLNWTSQYGALRQAQCTGTNFITGYFVAAHWQTDVDYYYCGGGTDPGTVSPNLAAGNCTPVYITYWVADGYGAASFSGSTTTSPTNTTTYTYTCANANGSSSSSVTVQVAGTTQCTDLVDNDGDGNIDAQDAGCSTTSIDPNVAENNDLPDLTVGAVTQSATLQGSATTLSATVTNGGGSATGAGFTNLFQIDNDSNHASVYTAQTASSVALAKNGTTLTSTSYTFPTAGTWYVRVCTDNNASFVGAIAESNENNNCDQGLTNWHTVTVSSNVPVATLTASPTSVPTNDSSSLTWACTNSTSASINQGIGSVWLPAGTGTVSSGSLSQTTSFTLTCTGAGGTSPGFATVTITVPTVTITANGTANSLLVKSGSSVAIAWTASVDATSCTVSGPGISSTAKNGSQAVTVTSLSTYTINCNGATKSVTVGLVPTFEEI